MLLMVASRKVAFEFESVPKQLKVTDLSTTPPPPHPIQHDGN